MWRDCEYGDTELDDLRHHEIDTKSISILDARALFGETVTETFNRKELELAVVFATLGVDDALAMQHRLAGMPSAFDELARKFARLLDARRARLIAFLGSARRRTAQGVYR